MSKGKAGAPRRGRRHLLARGAGALLALGFGVAVYVLLTLPDVRGLRTANPPTTAFMELRAREARARGATPRRVHRWVPYARISQPLKRAVLVAEDAKFWQHDGIDFAQLRESMEVNLERREFARGGSTITQQLAKNLYLSPSKNPLRKVRELLIARRLEAELPKERIFEIYLNVIEWGDGVWGAEAAARTYFGRAASEVGAGEAALLAASLVNPRAMNPGRPTPRLRTRQQMILRRMGAVTPPPASPPPAAPEPLLPVPDLPAPQAPLPEPPPVAPLDSSPPAGQHPSR